MPDSPISPSDPSDPSATSAASGPEAGDRPGPLVNAAWLAAHLRDPGLRLIHVSSLHEHYPVGHIAGALFSDLYEDLTAHLHDPAIADVELHYGVPSRSDVEGVLGRWGVGPSDRVVLYDDWARNRQAIRGLWLLRFHGWPAARVHVLDGGTTAWTATGHALTTQVPPPRTAAPVRLAGGDLASLATLEQVRAWSSERGDGSGPIRILDVRKPAEFVGEDLQSRRGGHVPGAVNVDWERFVNDDNTFKSPATIRSIVDAAVRAEGGEDATSLRATYCQGGVRAAAAWFVLAVLNDLQVANYARSWEEWGNRTDTPIAGGPPPPAAATAATRPPL